MAHYLVTAIVDFIVALIALNKRDNPAAKALSLASFSLGLWSLELFLLTVVSNVELLSILFHLTRWGMFFIPPSLALLAWMLIGARSHLFFNLVVLPGFAVSVCLSIFNAFIFPSELAATEGGYLPVVDQVFYIFAANFVWCLLGAVAVSTWSYRSATHRERQRVKWLLIILVMTLMTGVASMLLVTYDFYLKLVGATTNITFVCLLFYATVQHHLMDLRLALSVGLARIVLLTAVVWSYFFVASVVGDLSQSSTGIVMLFFIVFVLEAYPRALRWILPNAKKLIANNSYDFDVVTTEASQALNSCISLKELTRTTDVLIKQIARAADYELYVSDKGVFRGVNIKRSFDESSPEDAKFLAYCAENSGLILADETPEYVRNVLDAHQVSSCFSINFEGEAVGLMLVGTAVGQSYYRYDDIRVFEWLCQELGQVINRINQLDEMQQQLGQAKKTLSMLGVMNHYHHDIKAPLAIIDGVLSNDIYDKEKQKDIVLQQVERGSRLITTMANILKGERTRKIQKLSLEEVVKDSVFLFSQGIDEVHYDFSEVPDVKGDAEDLKILVINIIKNAIEARETGRKLVVTIATWQTDEAICLSFSDSGVGMPQQVVDTLWDDAVSSKLTGNGIGMQAIKRIADEHSADIEVNSKPGKGTEFIFKFPLSIVDEGKDDPPSDNDGGDLFSRVNKPMAG